MAMVRLRRAFRASALASGLAVSAVAGPAAAETLADALSLAYKRSNLLEQNRAVLRAADEDVAIAVAALRPVVSFIANTAYEVGSAYNAALPAGTRNSTISTLSTVVQLTAEITLYAGGANRLSIEAAKQTVLATRQALVGIEQEVLLSAVDAYLNVLSALEFVSIGNNNVRVLNEEVEAAQDRFEVGEITRTDVALVQSRLAAARANLAVAQGDLEVAREAYKVAVGSYPGVLRTPPAPPAVARSEDEAKAIAVRTNPRIRQLQFEVAASELAVQIAVARMRPRVSGDVTGGLVSSDRYNRARGASSTTDLSVGLTLNAPIYQGGALSAQMRQAQAFRDATRSDLLQTTLLVRENVGNAWAQLAVARARVAASEEQVRASRIAFEGFREEASLGARTTLDVLIAEQELLDALAARVAAVSDQFFAGYALLATMGVLTVDRLGLGVPVYDPEAYYNAVQNAPVRDISPQGERLDSVLRRLGKN